MRIMIKTPKKRLKINKIVKSMFSRNPIYPLPLEGLFPHISVATITTFPGTSLISSN